VQAADEKEKGFADHFIIRPLKDNVEVSPAPVSRFAPRTLDKVQNSFIPIVRREQGLMRQTSNPGFSLKCL
jgi:hypothetical protein